MTPRNMGLQRCSPTFTRSAFTTRFGGIWCVALLYCFQASYEKIKSVSSSAVRKPSSQPQPAIKIKSNENVIQRKKFENRGLLETLESRLEIGQYKPRGK